MIKAPGWCPNAIPTLKGWKHHVRPEILKPAKLTQEQIDEYNGVQVLVEAEPAPIAPTATMLTSNDNVYVDVDDDLISMTKTELEEVGREHGIELDRRKSKKTLIDTLKGTMLKD
tara:strand:- start:1596 stop:1940 length:345 start_codon:yes stop_codon:yes gene_type:complete